MLVLKLDNLLEVTTEQILSDEAKRMELIDKEAKKFSERINDVEGAIRMLDLKMRAEKKTKFV